MNRRPPRPTLTDTRFPEASLFRSAPPARPAARRCAPRTPRAGVVRKLGWQATTRTAGRRPTATRRRRDVRRAAARACPPWRRTHPPARPRPFARTQARAAGPRRSPLAARTPALVVRRQRRSPRRRRPRRIRNARRLAPHPRRTPALATVGRGYAPPHPAQTGPAAAPRRHDPPATLA